MSGDHEVSSMVHLMGCARIMERAGEDTILLTADGIELLLKRKGAE